MAFRLDSRRALGEIEPAPLNKGSPIRDDHTHLLKNAALKNHQKVTYC
jgi:hypothetical protein